MKMRWEHVKMRRCECEDVCEDVWRDTMWREDEQMWRCKMWRWDDKMWRCDAEKMYNRPPLLQEAFAQTLSGTKCLAAFYPFALWSFFFSSLLFPSLLFSSLLWLFPPVLLHLSILSEVSLLNFFRLCDLDPPEPFTRTGGAGGAPTDHHRTQRSHGEAPGALINGLWSQGFCNKGRLASSFWWGQIANTSKA